MFHLSRKFVAVLLAIWLPLFSGSSLAASVAMRTMNGDCHPAAAQSSEQPSYHVSTVHHHDQFDENQGQAAGQYDQQSSSCKDHGVCHFACGGFLATVAFDVTEPEVLTQTYIISATQFQSFTSSPLDPPPLARV